MSVRSCMAGRGPIRPAKRSGWLVDEPRVWSALKAGGGSDAARVREVLAKARGLGGLEPEEVADLTMVSDPELLAEVFETARGIKDAIYGKRLVLFAPVYVSNFCANECSYCAFRAGNSAVPRKALSGVETEGEAKALVDQGHKRVLLVAGGDHSGKGLDYILEAIEAVYRVKSTNGEIRRVNVNIAPLSVEEFRRLKGAAIGTYQVFQETYGRETYARVHLAGKKRDYDWRITAIDRAMRAGIDDVGIGVLFGLCDWRFEVLAMMQHIRHLEECFGVGPHTISVPRLEPACGSVIASNPPHAVGDVDFRKIVAILRMAVPYTGIIMSTREAPEMRRESLALGVSQISAGSRTNPGGYAGDGNGGQETGEQFSLGDHRDLDEVIRDVAGMGYIPSFCTACYRLGRTGLDFMEMAKPGEIKAHCDPNALSTFTEYLLDYATPETVAAGERCIANALAGMNEVRREHAEKMIAKVKGGNRDVFC